MMNTVTGCVVELMYEGFSNRRYRGSQQGGELDHVEERGRSCIVDEVAHAPEGGFEGDIRYDRHDEEGRASIQEDNGQMETCLREHEYRHASKVALLLDPNSYVDAFRLHNTALVPLPGFLRIHNDQYHHRHSYHLAYCGFCS